jgi:hypothetical protein
LIVTAAKAVGVNSSAVVITGVTATQSGVVLVRYNIVSTSSFDEVGKAEFTDFSISSNVLVDTML